MEDRSVQARVFDDGVEAVYEKEGKEGAERFSFLGIKQKEQKQGRGREKKKKRHSHLPRLLKSASRGIDFSAFGGIKAKEDQKLVM